MNSSINQIAQIQRAESGVFFSITEKEVGVSASCPSDLNSLFNEKLHDGKLLAKMLVNSIDDEGFSRLDRELVQLTSRDKVVRCAATSLLAPCPKQKLYRNIGFLVDAEKTKIHVIADSDVGSMPVDSQGYWLLWDKTKQDYEKISIRKGEIVNPDSTGRFVLDCDPECNKLFKTTKQLKDYMVEKAHLIKSRLNHNEVVCEYTTDSVLAVLITFNRTEKLYYERNQIINDGFVFKQKAEQSLGSKLPIFIFDCEEGTLYQQEA
ncbi:hypothetical protein [Endozoicomonas sp. ISHI1]|uniref:hypothetical protein n=1 Tax=Endozoicomonas sp. ISHI1 TaxID=2825882 RepID=UPI0021474B85|nr:hypothetical protein [Endozoicomonas sp. ISHI1]